MLTMPDFKKKQIVFAMLRDGEKLSFKNDNIIIKNSDGEIRHQSTCYRLFAVFVVGHAVITSGLIARAEKFGFSIILMNYSLRVYQVIASPTEGNVLLRKKQYSNERLDIASHIVRNKISNQIQAIKTTRQDSPKIKDAVNSMRVLKSRTHDAENRLQDLLGLEGAASRSYFPIIFGQMDWKSRKPRAKQDSTNCLLDIGYTYLFNIIEAMLNIYGFDLYQGVYHTQFYQRKSLVCDLVEPFRPIIDLEIRKAHNLGQINENDFLIMQKQYRLFGNNAKPYSALFIAAILARKEDIFRYVQQYYRAFMKNEPIENYPIFEL